MAGRPKIKIQIKPKDGGEPLWLLAAWPSDRGKGLNGRLDRDIEAKVKSKDGRVVDLQSCWINVYVNDDDDVEQRQQQRPAGRTHTRVVADADMPGDGGDDIPF